ncbi:hypothetical protein FRB99_004843 [Tulasnella sp. 403]|nr:hypothetical protein FRB99_004843 [Tulasnella sp. 403]
MRPLTLTIAFLFTLLAVAQTAPTNAKGGGIWNIISSIGTVFNIGSIIYGLIKDPKSGNPTSNNNTTQMPGPGYERFYPYTNYDVQGATFLARPDQSSGIVSATLFATGGGGWKKSGLTLPGTLSLHNPPYSSSCYGLDSDALAKWIHEFQLTYRTLTSRYPLIRTTSDFWSTCTANDPDVGASSHLWIVQPGGIPSTVPGGWQNWTFWDDGSASDTTSELAVVINGGLDMLRQVASANRSVRTPAFYGLVLVAALVGVLL